MEVIPVLDIMDGIAVAGESGRRWEYTELKSIYADTSDPLEIAMHLPHRRLYVADLDGIEKGNPNLSLLKNLGHLKSLIVDIGIKDYKDFQLARALNVDVVVATETLQEEDYIDRMIDNGCVISIDMKDGKVLSQMGFLEKPADAFEHFRSLGADWFIFLDISAVGTLSGSRFNFLRDIDIEDAEVIVGGGILPRDLPVLEAMGVDGVLIGTALHRGLFTC
jgi:phosphoribosylformimino-5-aminoimidazole carboxamide ribotide isomerase